MAPPLPGNTVLCLAPYREEDARARRDSVVAPAVNEASPRRMTTCRACAA